MCKPNKTKIEKHELNYSNTDPKKKKKKKQKKKTFSFNIFVSIENLILILKEETIISTYSFFFILRNLTRKN